MRARRRTGRKFVAVLECHFRDGIGGPFDNLRYAIVVSASVRMSRGFTAIWICNISSCGELRVVRYNACACSIYTCICIKLYIYISLSKPDLSSLVTCLLYAYLPSLPRLLTMAEACKGRNAGSFRPQRDDNTIIYPSPFEILILNHALSSSSLLLLPLFLRLTRIKRLQTLS